MTWEAMRANCDDDQIAALASLVAMINVDNRLNVIVRNPGGSYRPGQLAKIGTEAGSR